MLLGVKLSARLEHDQTTFHIGEVIPLDLAYSATRSGYEVSTAIYDRSGRLGAEQYEVEPTTGWDDPLQRYYTGAFVVGGGLSSNRQLSATPYVIHRDLNEWVRFSNSGRYRVVVTSTRVGLENRTLNTVNPVLRSNEFAINVVPANDEWQMRTLADAVTVLNNHKATENATTKDEKHERAVAVLRYMGTAAAAQEMARRLDDADQFQFMLGLVASPAHEAAIDALQHVLAGPLAPISSTFIYALFRLVSMGSGNKDISSLNNEYAQVVSELIKVLGDKRGRARTISAFSAAQAVSGGTYSDSQKEELSRYLAADFDELPAQSQAELLQSGWTALDPQRMLPILPKIAARYRDGPVLNEETLFTANALSAAALQHWWELDPAGARDAVLTEILRPKPRFGANVIGMLPEKELPEVDQALAEHLSVDNGHDEIVASLIARYATSAIESQIAGFLDEHVGKLRCDTQERLLAYLARVDASAAEPQMKRALASREQTGCYQTLLTEVARIYNDPILGKIATQALTDENPGVVGNAATDLGMYGTAADEQSLWDRLDSWTSAHKRKPDNMQPFYQSADEAAADSMIMAIATAHAWLADKGKLTRLLSYASTESQRSHVQQYLRMWSAATKMISAMGHQFTVAQYDEKGLSAAEEKLKQFPQGTKFSFAGDFSGQIDQDALTKLQKVGAAVGITVEAEKP